MYEMISSSDSVEIWMDWRLPFEPNGEKLVTRSALQEAVRAMRRPEGSTLAARYASLDTYRVDAENLLFYNVQPATFAAVSTGGLRFERIHTAPPPSPSGRRFAHYHRYWFVEAERPEQTAWACSFTFPLERLSTSSKPHEIWWAASGGAKSRIEQVGGPFELSISLRVSAPLGNLAGIIKPLLDGIICAMHPAAGVDPVAVRRLAEKTGWDAGAIEARLLSPSHPVLASRRQLHPYRDFVKWDPEDELCERCTVEVRPALGAVYEVSVAIRPLP